MLAILFYVISVSGPPVLLASESDICGPGMYQPEVNGDCKVCSSCPEPEIVRETCWGKYDTVCGKFTEFIHFRSSNTIKIVREEDTSTRKDIKRPTKPEVANDNGDEWHTITMVTIGVLAVSALLFSAFIIVICFKCRRQNKEGIITQIDRDSDFEKADPDFRYPVPGTSGNTTATSSIRSSFRSIEQFEIAEESPPE